MMKGRPAISIVPILLLLGVAAGIQAGLFSARFLGSQPPSIPRLQGEEVVEGTWVVCGGVRYTVWEIKQGQTGPVVFMVAASSSNELVRNMETLAKIFAIRLAIHTAEFVKSIGNAEENIDRIDKSLAAVGSISQIAGERRFASEVRRIRSQINSNMETVSELSLVLELSKNSADRLVEDHTDNSANAFLNSLIISGAISRSNTATVAVSLMLMGSQAGLPCGWIDNFLLCLDANFSPLEALAKTYGAQQASVTLQNMSARGM